MNNTQTGLLLICILLVGFLVWGRIKERGESLCIEMPYGSVTDIPASALVNSNMALVNDTSLGQAPLGDPRFWSPGYSPITQGMYSLYAWPENPVTYQALPVYTQP